MREAIASEGGAYEVVRSPAGGPMRSPTLNKWGQVRTPHKKIYVPVCQRHSYNTHTRAEFVPKRRRSPLFEAPLSRCTLRSHNSDPKSSGRIVATVKSELWWAILDRAAPASAGERLVRTHAAARRPHLGPRPTHREPKPRARALNCLSRFWFCPNWDVTFLKNDPERSRRHEIPRVPPFSCSISGLRTHKSKHVCRTGKDLKKAGPSDRHPDLRTIPSRHSHAKISFPLFVLLSRQAQLSASSSRCSPCVLLSSRKTCTRAPCDRGVRSYRPHDRIRARP